METVIIGTFLRDEASVSTYSLAMAKEFVNLGYKVIVITVERRTDLVDMNSNPIILTWPSFGASKFTDFLFLQNLIKKHNVKMLIGNFAAVNYFMIVGWMFRVPHRIAWIHTMSEQMIDVPKWKFYRKKYIYKLATKIIANSNATKNDAMNTFHIDERKIDVVPNLLKNNDFYISSDKMFKIVFVGRLHYSKGVDILIKALKVLVEEFPNILLEIIGSGDQKVYIELVKSYDLEDNINFLGKLPMKQVLHHLATAQFSVVPSREEAFGYTVIESFSVQTPVIGSNTGGIKDIIKDKINGFLFPVGNHIQLAQKMSYCLKNEKLLNKLSRASYDSYKNNYALENNIKDVVSMLDKNMKLIQK